MQTRTCSELYRVGMCDCESLTWLLCEEIKVKQLRSVLVVRLQPITVSSWACVSWRPLVGPPPPPWDLPPPSLWHYSPIRSIWWLLHFRHLAPKGPAPTLLLEPPGTPCLGRTLRFLPPMTMKNWETLVHLHDVRLVTKDSLTFVWGDMVGVTSAENCRWHFVHLSVLNYFSICSMLWDLYIDIA